MTTTLKSCAVKGELFNGRAMCGHHISTGNHCGVPETPCEHQVDKTQDEGQEKNEG